VVKLVRLEKEFSRGKHSQKTWWQVHSSLWIKATCPSKAYILGNSFHTFTKSVRTKPLKRVQLYEFIIHEHFESVLYNNTYTAAKRDGTVPNARFNISPWKEKIRKKEYFDVNMNKNKPC